MTAPDPQRQRGAQAARQPRLAAAYRPHRRGGHSALAIAGFALAALLAPALARPEPRLVWNASASVPIGLYRIRPGAMPRIGELAAMRPTPALARLMAERRYVEANALLIKPVAAGGGAHLCRIDADVTIDGRLVAFALPRDRLGRPLPRWQGCRTLGADQLALIAPALPGSFDSRYFGPVDRARVIGRAEPLWIVR